jgi:hypothetical protein
MAKTEKEAEQTCTVTYPSLASALAAAQAKCRPVAKNAENSFHHYKYASAEALFAEAKEAFTGTGLALVPLEMRVESKAESHTLVRKFALMHGDASLALDVQWPIIPDKGRPLDKAMAAAATASLAYLLRDLLQIPRVGKNEEMDSRDDTRRDEKPANGEPKIGQVQYGVLTHQMGRVGMSWKKVCELFGLRYVQGPLDLTEAAAAKIIEHLQKLPDKVAKLPATAAEFLQMVENKDAMLCSAGLAHENGDPYESGQLKLELEAKLGEFCDNDLSKLEPKYLKEAVEYAASWCRKLQKPAEEVAS